MSMLTRPSTRRCLFAAAAVFSAGALFAQEGIRYEVTVTNLTRNQRFTPILVATHREGLHLFEAGRPASPELRALAEEGNVAPFIQMLTAMPDRVLEAIHTPPPPPLDRLIRPGGSVSITVRAGGFFDHLSLASMLIPTNDAFFALDNVALPRDPRPAVYFVNAYDAGTERNDEQCGSIPGPLFNECVTASNPDGNGGGAQVGGGEGFVHVHNGMQGTGNFNRSSRDWRNPVAKVTIRRLN
jgi:hypothetical protein